ncbi:helix-turn-helix domain-containing protein [Nonomuraea terrae]|uniref:helix-turn-helix domain-containing protein n=1 Tax=Nonomuraea terrae TaxID=2530383 RepID=UPI0037A05A85
MTKRDDLLTVAQVLDELGGVSRRTFYRWRNRKGTGGHPPAQRRTPASMVKAKDARTWYSFAVAYVRAWWPHAAAKSREGMARIWHASGIKPRQDQSPGTESLGLPELSR